MSKDERMVSKIKPITELSCNCCNGRVGRELLELAEQHKLIQQMIVPTGVELIKQAAEIGVAAKEACNCCNGRVGKPAALQELVTALGGG